MKNIYAIFALLLLFASCSEWKYSKGTTWKNPEHNTARATFDEPQKELAAVEKDASITASEAIEPEISVTENAEIQETKSSPIDLEQVTIINRDEDTVQQVSEDALRIAFEAEEQGRKSRNLGIAGLILTLTYILAFIGLILSIIAMIKGVRSLKASYNTPKGVKMARAGVITSGITLGLYALSILLLILLLLIFI